MKKVLLFILDWLVLFSVAGFGIYYLKIEDLSTSWRTPIFINVFTTIVMIYVQLVHENKKSRFNSIADYAGVLIWVNIIGFVMQLTIGISGRYNHTGRIVKPLWQISSNNAIKIIAVYLILITISILLYRTKKNKKNKKLLSKKDR